MLEYEFALCIIVIDGIFAYSFEAEQYYTTAIVRREPMYFLYFFFEFIFILGISYKHVLACCIEVDGLVVLYLIL